MKLTSIVGRVCLILSVFFAKWHRPLGSRASIYASVSFFFMIDHDFVRESRNSGAEASTWRQKRAERTKRQRDSWEMIRGSISLRFLPPLKFSFSSNGEVPTAISLFFLFIRSCPKIDPTTPLHRSSVRPISALMAEYYLHNGSSVENRKIRFIGLEFRF